MLYPLEIGIETVNFCNARCPFCPLFVGDNQLDRSIRPATTMSMDLFESILDQIVSWPQKPTVIYLNMDGEPMMDRHLIQRLESIRRHRLSHLFYIQTNGQLMTEEKARAVVEAGIGSVFFALDGATRATYERSRVRCDFDEVLANLKSLVGLRDKAQAPTKIALKYVRTKDNAHEVRACYDLVSEFLGPQDQFHDTLALDWSDASLASSGLTFTTLDGAGNVRRKPGGCPSLKSLMVIHADGRVPACCWDYNFFVLGGHDFGDVSKQDVLSVWNGRRFEVLRTRLADPAAAPPRKCATCVLMHDYEVSVPPPAIEGAVHQPGYGYTYSFAPRVAAGA
jgi:pyruvate-formate lyase-activating enzyme